MKYFLVLLFSYLSILFVFSSCKKNCEDNYTWGDDGLCPEADQSYQDMKAWYYFADGTYWIYEEQNTGIIDTLTVVDHHTFLSDSTESLQWYAESTVGYSVTIGINDHTYEDCNEKPGCPCHAVFSVRSRPGGGLTTEYSQMYPHYVGNWIDNFDDHGKSTVLSVKNHLQFGDFLFYNVAEFQLINEENPLQSGTTYKYAKNVGLIERKIPAINEHWKLIEYHIVQ
jgi:hypothetical protein